MTPSPLHPAPGQQPLGGTVVPVVMFRVLLALAGTGAMGHAMAQTTSFAELEAAGARIGQIHILNQDIFDLADPAENNALFRLANGLHIKTRPEVIRSQLLFKPGDAVSVRVMEETERLLRTNRYLYDVQLRPVPAKNGAANLVDVEVLTRDTWTLDPGATFARSGGANSSSVSIKEFNLLGTGLAVGYSRINEVDRSGNEFQLEYNHALDGWTQVAYSLADNTDGKRQAVSVIRPFYALDTRWAAGARLSQDNRIDSAYTAGNISSQYRHRQDSAELFAGWSAGLQGGRAHRYSIGLIAKDDAFSLEPALVAPPLLPTGQKTVAPFVRYELVEDDFQQLNNRNQIGRPEFFARGLAATVQIERALPSLGSSHDLWLYSGTVSRGYRLRGEQDLFATASLSGQFGNGQVQRQTFGTALRYYLPLNKRYLAYAAFTADVLTNPQPTDTLTLGGDTGLRGYPLRYQSGDQRALLTVEARGFSDLYLFRLFRVGGAAFYDIGRAWGGQNASTAANGNTDWLSNIGAGLRISSTRTAFGNVLHIDLAVPANRAGDISAVQLLVKTKASF